MPDTEQGRGPRPCTRVYYPGRCSRLHHRRGQLPAAELAHRPCKARLETCRACACLKSAHRARAPRAKRRTMRRCSRFATWSAPASTSSATARCGARATRTASPPRSRASTSVTREHHQPQRRACRRAAHHRSDQAPRPGRSARRAVPARQYCKGRIKITVPGPFTMAQQTQDDYYKDDEALALAFAAAVTMR